MPLAARVESHINAIKLVSDSEHIDIIMMQCPFDMYAMTNRTIPAAIFIKVVTEMTIAVNKPIAIVLHYAVSLEGRRLLDNVQAQIISLGLPVFPSFQRAASAIDKYIEYNLQRRI